MVGWKITNKKELENLGNIRKIKMATVSVRDMYQIQIVRAYKAI